MTIAPKRKKPSGWDHVLARRKKAADEAAKAEVTKYQSRVLASPGGGGGVGAGTALYDLQWDPNGPPVELPIYGQPPANLNQIIQGILGQLEQGAFYQSAYLWDGMTRDDRVAATVGQRIDRLIASPIVLKPSDPDEGTETDELGPSQEAALECEKVIQRLLPMPEVYELSRIALGLGVGLAQVVSTATNKGLRPSIYVWNLRNFRYDWAMRQFRLITENKGEIGIDPEDPEWILYQPYGHYGWLHGAMIRSIAQPWLIRYWSRTWWARYQEVHGQPIRLGIIPPDRKPADEKNFLTQLANMAHEGVIRLPQGSDGNRFDVKLLEAATNSWEGFQKLLEHCDDSIAITVLGQRQSTMGEGGLKAQDNAGESTLVRLTRKDALIAHTLREKVLKPWAYDEYGNEELAPILTWEYEAPEDEEAAANTDLKVSQSLTYFKAANAPLDVRKFLIERGYPLLSLADVEALKEAERAELVKNQEAFQQSAVNQPDEAKPGLPSANGENNDDANKTIQD